MNGLTGADLSQLVNNIKSGSLVLDHSGAVVFWNKWMERYSRISHENAIGCHYADLFPGTQNSRLGNAINQVTQYGCPAVLSNVLNPHPLALWVPGAEAKRLIHQAINITPVQQAGERSFCMLEISDVTPAVMRQKSLEIQVMERKQIENALREAHKEMEIASAATNLSCNVAFAAINKARQIDERLVLLNYVPLVIEWRACLRLRLSVVAVGVVYSSFSVSKNCGRPFIPDCIKSCFRQRSVSAIGICRR